MHAHDKAYAHAFAHVCGLILHWHVHCPPLRPAASVTCLSLTLCTHRVTMPLIRRARARPRRHIGRFYCILRPPPFAPLSPAQGLLSQTAAALVDAAADDGPLDVASEPAMATGRSSASLLPPSQFASAGPRPKGFAFESVLASAERHEDDQVGSRLVSAPKVSRVARIVAGTEGRTGSHSGVRAWLPRAEEGSFEPPTVRMFMLGSGGG